MNQTYTFSHSSLEQIEGIDVFHLHENSHYETGYAAGKLLVLSQNPVLKFLRNPLFQFCTFIVNTRQARNFSTPLLMRLVLEQAKSVSEARNVISSHLPTKPVHIMVTSYREMKTVSFEVSSSKAETFETNGVGFHACTNHFRSSGRISTRGVNDSIGSKERLAACESMLKEISDLTVEQAIQILRDTRLGLRRDSSGHSITNEGTLQSFVFRFPEQRIHISNGDKLPVTLSGKYVEIHLFMNRN